MGDRKRKSDGRFEMYNEFIDHGIMDAGLTHIEVSVWCMLWRHTRGGVAEVAMTTAQRCLVMSRSSVNKAIRGLLAKGMLRLIERGNLHGKRNRYRIYGSPVRVEVAAP